MQKRKFDELISHFNRKVSDMSIDQKYKMELLGMISAIGFAHEKELSTNLASLGTDCISRQDALEAFGLSEKTRKYGGDHSGYDTMMMYEIQDTIENLPTIQTEIVRCKDCQYWNKGSCECPEHAVNCQDYYVGDIETEAEYFCGYAERREVTT